MTPQELKASVLQLAMQGKITKQTSSDGSAQDLLKHLFIDKKIKPTEPPFDIPDNWLWIPVGNLGASLDTDSFSDGPFGSNLKTDHQISEPEVRIIQLSNIGEDGWKNKNVKYTSYKHLETVIPRCEVHPGDFVIAKMMPAGRTIQVPDLGTRITLGSDAMKFVPNPILDKQYLLYAMRSQAFLEQVYAEAHGITRVRTTLNGVKSYVLPIPPLAEQKRIVAKIEELLPLIDRYEQAWSNLEDFNKRFPIDMQKAILQMAIQGKLVPQISEEGTGEELFQQIQIEKQRLIKEGVIKKEKPQPEISGDEIPFDIPDSWKWVRVGDYVQKVTDYVASGSFASLKENVKIYKEPNYAILVKTKDFQSNFTNDLTYTDKHGYEFLENSRLFGGELIMPNIGASIGKVFKVPYLDAKMTLAPNSVLIRFVSEEHLNWFSYYFASPIGFAQLKDISSSTAQAKFSKTEFKGLLIPIPPLAEQKRIVAKLEEILPLCERLK